MASGFRKAGLNEQSSLSGLEMELKPPPYSGPMFFGYSRLMGEKEEATLRNLHPIAS